VLLDRQAYGSYEDAAFSFERAYGGRERTGKDKARNDWDVVFESNGLRVDTVTDDRSLIVDLGVARLAELGRQPLARLEGMVRAAATTRYEDRRKDARAPAPAASLGHCYFVWTDDSDSDAVALFEVVELTAGDRCVLDWHATEDGSFGRGSVLSPTDGVQLATVALKLRDAAQTVRTDGDAPLLLKQPRVQLQARAGAVGGNPCRIDLGRGRTAYFDRIVGEPIPFGVPAIIDDDAVGYGSGGKVPDDKMLVITAATWRGDAHGDTNGGGCFWVQLGDVELVRVKRSEHLIEGTWNGRVEIRPGQEERVFLEISNSSRGEVLFEGHFEQRRD
jgi:hypothetical protein